MLKIIFTFIFTLSLISLNPEPKKIFYYEFNLIEQKSEIDPTVKYKTTKDTIFILDGKKVTSDEWLNKSEKITVTDIYTKKDKITVTKIVGETNGTNR